MSCRLPTTRLPIYTHAHAYIRELIKNSRPIRSLASRATLWNHYRQRSMEGGASTDFTRFSPLPPPVRAIQLAIKCIVVSFGVARETPIYLLPLGSLLRSFEHFRQVEFRAAFMGFFRNFNDVQLREFVRFPISPVNICRISCESLANYHLLPRQSSPTIFFFLNVNVRNAVERKYIFRRNCNALLKSLKALALASKRGILPALHIPDTSAYSIKGHKEGCGSKGGGPLRITKAAIRDFDFTIHLTKQKSGLCSLPRR